MADIASFLKFKADDNSTDTAYSIRKIKASQIIVLPQVRTKFDEDGIKELAQSIKEIGLQEPISVIKSDPKGDSFILVNGERRFRALQLIAGDQFPQTYVECKVQKKASDDGLVELIQFADNMVRKDLTVSEQAQTVKRLAEKGMTHEKIGLAIGKSRTIVSKLMSLADLPERFTPLLDLTDDYTLLYNFKVLADKYSSSPEVDQFAKQCIDANEITRASVAELKRKLEGQMVETRLADEPLEMQDAATEETLQVNHPSENYPDDSKNDPEEEVPEMDSSPTPAQLNEGQSKSAAKAHGSAMSKREHGIRKFISYNKRANKFVLLLDDDRKVEVSLSQLKVRV